MEKDQAGEFAVYPEEAAGEGRLAIEPDDPPRHRGDDVPPDVDDSVPGAQRPRIDA
jgi:hypothetical protein